MLLSEKQAIEAKLDPDAVDQQVGCVSPAWLAEGLPACCGLHDFSSTPACVHWK